MPDITVAVDEVAANKMVHVAEAMMGMLSKTGSGSLGPFTATWGANASFTGGIIDLIPPDVVRIADCNLHYSLSFSFSFDLSDIIPDFCLPRVCVPIPFDGELCTPEICVNWPTVSIPVSYTDILKFTADFTLDVHLGGLTGPADPDWFVDIVIVGIPFLQTSAAAAAIVTAIGVAAAVILAPIPFIGPFLSIAVAALAATIGIAGVTGLLGQILTPFVAGRTFTIYQQPDVIQVLPPALPLDPAVNVKIVSLTAAVVGSDEDELVLTADISP